MSVLINWIKLQNTYHDTEIKAMFEYEIIHLVRTQNFPKN